MRRIQVDFDRLAGAMRGKIGDYADRYGIHRNTVSAKINATRKDFKIEDLNRFAEFLGRDPMDFVVLEDESKKAA